MYASFTSGTYHFLEQLTKKHLDKYNFYFMKNNRTTIVYYEHKRKKSIFVSGKTFSILKTYETIQPKGFVTMEHVPISGDGVSFFEGRAKKIFLDLTERRGVVAMRLLKQLKKNEFVIMTQWKSERDEQFWRNSPAYEYHNVRNFARLSAYFAERPFVNSFYMVEEEDEVEDVFEEDEV